MNPNALQSTEGSTKTEEAASTEDAPKAESPTSEDASMPEEATKTDEPSSNEEPSNAEEAAMTDEAAATTDVSPKSDESPESDTGASGVTTENANREEPPTTDSTDSRGIQDYYGYRSEPVDSRYGDDQNAPSDENVTPSNSDSADGQAGGDGTTMNAEDSNDEDTGDADNTETSPLADAMQAVISRWAEDFAISHGLKMSEITSLVGPVD